MQGWATAPAICPCNPPRRNVQNRQTAPKGMYKTDNPPRNAALDAVAFKPYIIAQDKLTRPR